MRNPASRFLPLLTILSILPVMPATAQPGAPSFDQYPSFLQLTSSMQDGTQVVLRCGYSSPNGQSVVLDPGFQEVSFLNQARGGYSRFQHIDNAVIATFTPPAGMQGVLLELVKADGSVMAKNCQMDVNNDTIANCQPAQPLAPAAQIKDQDQKTGAQCVTMLQQGGSQVNPSLASVPKTEAFKSGLRQKVNTLAAP
jgi:hypothetical protein